MADCERFNVLDNEVHIFAVVGSHAWGYDLDPDMFGHHLYDTLFPHVREGAALTRGPGVPTYWQVRAAVARLRGLDRAGLRCLQLEQGQRGIQFSVQS